MWLLLFLIKNTRARAAFELHSTLRCAVHDFFAAQKANVKTFQEQCADAIKRAQPVLNTHRGYKQCMLDVINVILACITFRPATINVGKWRFFEVNTATMSLVTELVRTIKENLEPSHAPKM